jgi:N utilization substance protein B
MSKPSAKVMKASARLLAVQAVYQASLNEQSLTSAAAEYLEYRTGMDIDGEELVAPNKALFTAIVQGVEERRVDLGHVISTHMKNGGERSEILLKSLLMCASYELLAHGDVDTPVILNDYLNVAHAFFEKGEVSLVNGVLDNVAKALRSA